MAHNLSGRKRVYTAKANVVLGNLDETKLGQLLKPAKELANADGSAVDQAFGFGRETDHDGGSDAARLCSDANDNLSLIETSPDAKVFDYSNGNGLVKEGTNDSLEIAIGGESDALHGRKGNIGHDGHVGLQVFAHDVSEVWRAWRKFNVGGDFFAYVELHVRDM